MITCLFCCKTSKHLIYCVYEGYYTMSLCQILSQNNCTPDTPIWGTAYENVWLYSVNTLALHILAQARNEEMLSSKEHPLKSGCIVVLCAAGMVVSGLILPIIELVTRFAISLILHAFRRSPIGWCMSDELRQTLWFYTRVLIVSSLESSTRSCFDSFTLAYEACTSAQNIFPPRPLPQILNCCFE